jgi:pentatricopeptide repeat protein
MIYNIFGKKLNKKEEMLCSEVTISYLTQEEIKERYPEVRKENHPSSTKGYNEKFHNRGKAIEILNKSLELHIITEGQKIDTYLKLGNLYLEERDTARAEACYSKALNMQEDILQKGDMLFQMGGKYYEAKEYAKASEYLDRAFEIGFNHTKKIYINGSTIAQVMDVYIKSGRMDRAEEVYNRLREKGVVKKNKKVEKLLYEKSY